MPEGAPAPAAATTPAPTPPLPPQAPAAEEALPPDPAAEIDVDESPERSPITPRQRGEQLAPQKRSTMMPGWIVWIIKWGGLIVAIVALLSILFVEAFAPVPEATTQPGQVILLAVGLILALFGFILERRSSNP